MNTPHTHPGLKYLRKRGVFTDFGLYCKTWWAYPDVLRWRGSVLLSTLPGVIGMTLFSCGVCLLHLHLGISLNVPVSVLGTVSVALGLLLAFRVNSAYDRYWEGRKLVQSVIATVRNLSRQVWINIPEDTQADHLEKMRCVKLLLAFVVATKHHLRHEYGMDYDDLKSLLPPGWKPCSVVHSGAPLTEAHPENGAVLGASARSASSPSLAQGLRRRQKRVLHKLKSLPLVVSLYDDIKPADHDGSLDADDVGDIANIRRSQLQQEFPDADVAHHATADLLRRQASNDSALLSSSAPTSRDAVVPAENGENGHHHLHKKLSKFAHEHMFVSEEDLPEQGDADISLPLEILFLIALFVNQAKRDERIDSNFVSITNASLDSLVNALTAFERIVHTPIPKAYNIHLKQGVVLYIFFLPFCLVDSLGWLVTAIVALVAFTLFGIEAIGAEIENPFGYDYNDLPLNTYCEELKKEVAYIIYHIPTQTNTILLDGQ